MKIEEVKEDSVQKWVENNWPTGPCREMSTEDAQTFIGIVANEEKLNAHSAQIENDVKSMKNISTILWNMLKNIPTDITTAGMMAIDHIAQPHSPGECLMIQAYVQYQCRKNGIEKLDARGVGIYIFPNGAPTHEDFDKLWDAQKVPGHQPDNMLNIPQAYVSITM